MDEAKWYFTHETEEDRLWYQIFFFMCRKFNVSWTKASDVQKAFIQEITRIDYEREAAKKSLRRNPFEDSSTQRFPPDPRRAPHSETSGRDQWTGKIMTFRSGNAPEAPESGTHKVPNQLTHVRLPRMIPIA